MSVLMFPYQTQHKLVLKDLINLWVGRPSGDKKQRLGVHVMNLYFHVDQLFGDFRSYLHTHRLQYAIHTSDMNK